MENIHNTRIEETDWSRHWQNVTAWGMEYGTWKEETNFLEKVGI
jgi:hypothetical protein